MDPSDDLPIPGDVLSDKYTIVRTMTIGGMGVVYEATHNRIGQRVAVKVLHPNMKRSAEYVERFEREARAAGCLKSRYAVRILDVAETPKGLPYMVMDFLEGRDLQAELERRGPLPMEEAVEYLLQTCAAMAEAHDMGIVHRDLKPANLFLCEDAGEVIVRVLDFGISKHTLEGDSSVTTTQTAIGTPLYMSPEQVRSARTVDARADIWSLGVIAYEMLSGRTPFPGENPTATIAAIVADEIPALRSYRPELPEELAQVVHLALQKRPEDRYPDIRVFAAALSPFARPGSTTRIGPPRPRGALPSVASQPSLPVVSGPVVVDARGNVSSPAGRSGPHPHLQPGATIPTWTAHGGQAASRSKMLGALSAGLVLGLGLVVWLVHPFGAASHARPAAASAPAPPPITQQAAPEVTAPDTAAVAPQPPPTSTALAAEPPPAPSASAPVAPAPKRARAPGAPALPTRL